MRIGSAMVADLDTARARRDRREERRELTAEWLDEAVVAESARTIKGLAKRCEVPRQKLLAMRKGMHGVDVATVLGLPARVRDAFFERVAIYCEREWAHAVEPADVSDFHGAMDMLREAFEAAWKELRAAERARDLTPSVARRLRPHLRKVRRIVTGFELLCDRVIAEDEEEERRDG